MYVINSMKSLLTGKTLTICQIEYSNILKLFLNDIVYYIMLHCLSSMNILLHILTHIFIN